MKRILFALLLLPQLAFSQYRADCFSLDLSDNVSQTKIGNTFDKDTTLNISVRTTISGLSISGTAVLDNDNDSYIRVTLVDNYNYEFLVYENYPALSDDLTTKFSMSLHGKRPILHQISHADISPSPQSSLFGRDEKKRFHIFTIMN